MANLTLVERPAPPEKWRAPIRLTDAPDCDLASFSCGSKPLDSWLHDRARPSDGKHARTYIVLAESGRVVGYHTVTMAQILRAELPKSRLRQNAPDIVPGLLLARLGVELEFQHYGLGTVLLRHALTVCLSVAEAVGTRGMLVHPINAKARAFYADAGFLNLLGNELPPMILPVEDIERAL